MNIINKQNNKPNTSTRKIDNYQDHLHRLKINFRKVALYLTTKISSKRPWL